MKDFKFFGIIALAAVIVFALAACESPTDSGSKSLTGIAVTTLPAKVQYNLNETFDPMGMAVTATYSDRSTEAVTGYETSGFSSDTAGNKTITVTYQGKTATFAVTVIDPSKETVATPTANPVAGGVASGTTVALSTTTSGAEIWYTSNGDLPAKDGTGSTKYTAPIAITAAVTIRAIAVKDGMNDSAVLEAAYTVNQTPVAEDFNISGAATYTFDGSHKSVTITPKQGKTTGAITIYYNESATAPSVHGVYTVTFDVAAAPGWNAVTGLSAGTLTINAVPVAADFEIGNLNQTVGNVTAVTITPKEGKSGGAITIYYNGSTTLPTAIGTYAVTFNVAAATGFNAAAGLSAGTLTILTANNTIGIQFTGFSDEAIDLTKDTGNDIRIGESLTVMVNGDFDDVYYNVNYYWYLNGNYDTSTDSNSHTLLISDTYPIGIHTITVAVIFDLVPYYSKTVTFRVVR